LKELVYSAGSIGLRFRRPGYPKAHQFTRKGRSPQVKRGLAATAGGLVRLPWQLPYRIALELALTGDMFPAARAYQYGLINRLTKPGEALAEARQLAQTIAANGPLSVAASKRVIVESQDWLTSAIEAWPASARLRRPRDGLGTTGGYACVAMHRDAAHARCRKRPKTSGSRFPCPRW
jgi:hypothetical protein